MLSTTFELNSIKKSFENNFKDVMKSIENLEYNANLSGRYSSYDRQQNVIIRKKLVDYLINSIDFNKAVEFLKIEFDLSQNIIDNVLKIEYDIFTRKNLQQKLFVAQNLLKKDFKFKDISRLLDIKESSLRYYLKK